MPPARRPLAALVAALGLAAAACGAAEEGGSPAGAPPVPVAFGSTAATTAPPATARPTTTPPSRSTTSAGSSTEAPTTLLATAPPLSSDVPLPQIVAPLDAPAGTGPVATDPAPLPDNPSRPVGVPLLPGEEGYLSCQVSIVGDSLTVAGSRYLADALRGQGCAAVSIAAKGGANTSYGVRLATDLEDAGLLTDVVLVNMGTNDCASDPDALDRSIDAMFRVLGPDRLVVWPTSNISRTTPYCEPDGDDRANARIFAAAERHPNMRVIDWHAFADQHPEWHPDGVHHNLEGMRTWSAVLASAVVDALG